MVYIYDLEPRGTARQSIYLHSLNNENSGSASWIDLEVVRCVVAQPLITLHGVQITYWLHNSLTSIKIVPFLSVKIYPD